jgi:hypothetical protein
MLGSRPPVLFPACRVLAFAVLTIGSAGVALATAPPAGLSAADWESLRAQVTAAQYAAAELETGGYAAGNQAHGIRVDFGPDGATSLAATREGAPWRGSLRFTGYGYETLQPVDRPRRLCQATRSIDPQTTLKLTPLDLVVSRRSGRAGEETGAFLLT